MQKLRLFLALSCTAAIAAVSGFSLGQSQGIGHGMSALETEVTGSLAVHVEAASYVRAGNTERALSLLDQRIDTAVISLVDRREFDASGTALQQAKAYRVAVAPDGELPPTLRQRLDAIPTPEGAALSPGLRTLVEGVDR